MISMFKTAPEGYPYIVFPTLIAVAVITVFGGWTWIALLPLALTLFMVFFFRDPEREIPGGDNIFVSPADGRVILINKVYEDQYLKDEAVEVSIFMSPLNVHVNRSPCDGVVEKVVYTPGRFLSAFKHEASLQNENIAMLLNTAHGRILVRQVAGFLARRAVCRVKPGDVLKKGDRYGIIKFSSRLDVYLPEGAAVRVKSGDRVKAGETVIGEI
ncbi:MAG: phosphatidylserine decarboxylase family protein [Thermodesulfovibrionales bacterium]